MVNVKGWVIMSNCALKGGNTVLSCQYECAVFASVVLPSMAVMWPAKNTSCHLMSVRFGQSDGGFRQGLVMKCHTAFICDSALQNTHFIESSPEARTCRLILVPLNAWVK
jgi:hypothetical protein